VGDDFGLSKRRAVAIGTGNSWTKRGKGERREKGGRRGAAQSCIRATEKKIKVVVGGGRGTMWFNKKEVKYAFHRYVWRRGESYPTEKWSLSKKRRTHPCADSSKNIVKGEE